MLLRKTNIKTASKRKRDVGVVSPGEGTGSTSKRFLVMSLSLHLTVVARGLVSECLRLGY